METAVSARRQHSPCLLERRLCNSCAQYDWNYHLRRRESERYEKDEETWGRLHQVAVESRAEMRRKAEEERYRAEVERQRAQAERNRAARERNNVEQSHFEGWRYYEPIFPIWNRAEAYSIFDDRRDFFPITGDRYPGQYYLGSGKTSFQISPFSVCLQNQSHCNFCALIVHIARKESPEEFHNLSSSMDPLVCNFVGPGYCETRAGIEETVVEIGRLGEQPWQISHQDVKIRLTVRGTYLDWVPRDSINVNQVDRAKMTYWYRKCLSSHDICQQLKTDDALLQNQSFKVIDVIQNRVVMPPRSCRYVALSYVWGAAKIYRARQQDFIQANGGLAGEHSYLPLQDIEIPRTIQDAIAVVQELGEQYLWVDALCIVNDDPSEFQRMIEAMHLVYQNAILTIIASDNKNADEGLSRLREQSEKSMELTANIDGTDLLGIGTRSGPDLSKTSWAQRGWTYQEGYCSNKLLIFSNRVQYRCSHGHYLEERPDESQDRELEAFIRPNKRAELGDTSSITSTPFPRLVCGHDESPCPHCEESLLSKGTVLQDYASHVRQYTSRTLTNSNDILNAFAGMTSLLSKYYYTKFCWGMPTSYFGTVICWTPSRADPNSLGFKVKGRDSSIRRANFPSWSWAGYVGDVHYDQKLMNILEPWTTDKSPFIQTMILPWNEGDKQPECVDEVLKSGILTVECETATLLAPAHIQHFQGGYELGLVKALLDDGSEWTNRMKCVRIGFNSNVSGYVLGHYDRSVSIILTISEVSDGLYVREGLFGIRTEIWEDANPQRKMIRLA